jgi:hypothetical protein
VITGKVCPLLDKEQRYVVFGGNGHKKGREHYHRQAYRLATWMVRAGYATDDPDAYWDEARRFLTDLQTLSGPFGLVAGGCHPDKREWQPLERLNELTRTLAGRQWLQKCRLLVYGPENYQVAWRQELARQLGFRFIPGGADEGDMPVGKQVETPTAITSPLELDAWMRGRGMTDRELAQRLGVSQPLVSDYHSGRRPWSARFEERLAAYSADAEG